MDLDLLHERAKRFHQEYLNEKRDVWENEQMRLRDSFVKGYDLDYFEHKITKENYCLGDWNRNSFCYKVERELSGLGSARGGVSDKFIVFYSNKKNEYRTGQHYPTDFETAFQLVKKDLINIYKAAKADRIEDVKQTKFWYIIKYKIYWLYNPSKDIPVFKKDHVNKIIKEWNITSSNDESAKRKALFDFKNNDSIFSVMSNVEFMNFLYSPYSGLKLKEDKDDKETDYFSTETQDIPLEKFEGQYIKNSKHNALVRQKRDAVIKNIDFNNLNNKKKTLGTFGEILIINDETSKLRALGINKTVEHSSLEIGDGLGYDITSYDERGNEIFIEVKTTTSNRVDGFYLTKKEREVAEANKDKYKIYRVYSLNKNDGKYKVQIFDYKTLMNVFNLNPIQFIAEFKEE